MAYVIRYTERALKYLESLDKHLAQQMYKKIKKVEENPLRSIERLATAELWKLRIGDYRAILVLDRAKEEVITVNIGHRKDIYKNL